MTMPMNTIPVTTPHGRTIDVPLVWTPEWVGQFIDAEHVPEIGTVPWLIAVLEAMHEVEHLRIGMMIPPTWKWRKRRRLRRLHRAACERNVQRMTVARMVTMARGED